MTSPAHRSESTASAALSVAVELRTKEWLLTMSVGAGAPRVRARVAPGDWGRLSGCCGPPGRASGSRRTRRCAAVTRPDAMGSGRIAC